ncbi:MAG: hypothetical protein KTR31_07825 [Myxococcales bacterium]|nr:hypothetical protein [Myxococcales bacterium]
MSTVLWLLWSAASAQEPMPPEPDPTIVDDGTLVDRIWEVTPFRLGEAHPYRHARTPRSVKEGAVVVLSVAPWTQVARPVGVPLLWVGDQLAVRLTWGDREGCAVVWVPRRPEPSDLVFFGTTELPERMGPAQRVAQAGAAQRRGISARSAEEWRTAERPLRSFVDFRELHAWATQRRCTSAGVGR